METSFSEVFSGDVLADKGPTQPSNPAAPASGTLGSQPASSRQPQGPAGQVVRASVLPFLQVRPGTGLNTPHPTEGPPSGANSEFQANATDAFRQAARPLTCLPAAAESAEAAASRLRLEHMWATSKSPGLSFRSSIRGGSSTELSFESIVSWLVSLLPVADSGQPQSWGAFG